MQARAHVPIQIISAMNFNFYQGKWSIFPCKTTNDRQRNCKQKHEDEVNNKHFSSKTTNGLDNAIKNSNKQKHEYEDSIESCHK